MFIWVGIGSSQNEDPSKTEAHQKISELCQELSLVKGTFEQRATSPTSGRVLVEKGFFTWVRPDHFRWVTTEPEYKDIIWTGGVLKYYIAEDCVIYTSPPENVKTNPFFSFLLSCDMKQTQLEMKKWRILPTKSVWVFREPVHAESEGVWESITVIWEPKKRQVTIRAIDWLESSIEFSLEYRSVRNINKKTWETAFPEECEEIPLESITPSTSIAPSQN